MTYIAPKWINELGGITAPKPHGALSFQLMVYKYVPRTKHDDN